MPEKEIRELLQRTQQLGNVVHVTVPPKAAFDFDSMQRITKEILGRLGCGSCHSGWDIRFGLEREFVVDEKLNIRAAGF